MTGSGAEYFKFHRNLKHTGGLDPGQDRKTGKKFQQF